MKKLLTSKKLYIILATVIVVCGAGAYFGRGAIRSHVLPWAIQQTRAKSFKHASDQDIAALGDPFKLLGYQSAETSPVRCTMTAAKHFATRVYCSYTTKASGPMPTDPAARATIVQNAATLQDKLKANGWQGTYDETSDTSSLKKLVTNIAHSIDYTPDAAYHKGTDIQGCIFDSNTAFSSPAPAAMASQVTCWQSFDLFGTPPHASSNWL